MDVHKKSTFPGQSSRALTSMESRCRFRWCPCGASFDRRPTRKSPQKTFSRERGSRQGHIKFVWTRAHEVPFSQWNTCSFLAFIRPQGGEDPLENRNRGICKWIKHIQCDYTAVPENLDQKYISSHNCLHSVAFFCERGVANGANRWKECGPCFEQGQWQTQQGGARATRSQEFLHKIIAAKMAILRWLLIVGSLSPLFPNETWIWACSWKKMVPVGVGQLANWTSNSTNAHIRIYNLVWNKSEFGCEVGKQKKQKLRLKSYLSFKIGRRFLWHNKNEVQATFSLFSCILKKTRLNAEKRGFVNLSFTLIPGRSRRKAQ